MDATQFLGYLVPALVTLGGFIAIIMKFTQPINELRVVIQKLLDRIEYIDKENDQINHRVTKHGEEIDQLKTKVNELDTKVKLYHDAD